MTPAAGKSPAEPRRGRSAQTVESAAPVTRNRRHRRRGDGYDDGGATLDPSDDYGRSSRSGGDGVPSRRLANPNRSSPPPGRRDDRRRGTRASDGRRSRADGPRSADRQQWSQEQRAARAVGGQPTRAAGADAYRFSANVVLLAHGNRSLHVLAVQRCQSYVAGTPNGRRGIRRKLSPSSATVVVRYKL